MKRNFISHLMFSFLLFLFMSSCNLTQTKDDPGITIYPAPPEEILSKDYTLEVNGKPVDVMPTLIGLMGIEKPEMDGADFSPLLTGGDMEVPEFAFLSFYKGGAPERYRQWRAVYSERLTYVTVDDWLGWENSNIPQNGGAALYDRKADPFQQKPIFRGEGTDALMDKMHTALKKHLDEQNDPFLENCWAERSGKETVTDPTARYDALIDRYYKQVP